jgi:hypothetical protein
MSKIISARAYANNEVIYLAWLLDSPIPGCRGFDIKRIDVLTGQDKSLLAWVPFEGQTNADWKPETTSVWPVQRLSWKERASSGRDRFSGKPRCHAHDASPFG